MNPSAPPASATLPRHPISVVVDRTGLSQHLLRVWERRYGAVEPTRGQGKHRLYSDADIARLRLLHAATRAGRSIGQVARLSTEELSRMAAEDAAARAGRGGPATTGAGSALADAARAVTEQALALTLALDGPALDDVLRRAAARLGLAEFIEQVVTPLLRRIGQEWHAGRLTIAQEHLASSTVHDILGETMRSFPRGNGAVRMVVATPPGERHAIGATGAAAAAAAEGWGVVYLGSDLPAGEIAAAAVATEARLVAVSVVYVDDRERILGELRTLRARLPAAVSLLAGGAGATALAAELAGSGIRIAASLSDLRDALRDAARPDEG
ncbi:MAG TPA: MerR family transcriptional regulator [Gemmatimonadaceae bacterium]|nr:MerR family transcriptional regulator [Gemmatimonadaceae bacterium]